MKKIVIFLFCLFFHPTSSSFAQERFAANLLRCNGVVPNGGYGASLRRDPQGKIYLTLWEMSGPTEMALASEEIALEASRTKDRQCVLSARLKEPSGRNELNLRVFMDKPADTAFPDAKTKRGHVHFKLKGLSVRPEYSDLKCKLRDHFQVSAACDSFRVSPPQDGTRPQAQFGGNEKGALASDGDSIQVEKPSTGVKSSPAE